MKNPSDETMAAAENAEENAEENNSDSPNYDAEMAQDAKEFADQFAAMISAQFPGAKVTVREVTDALKGEPQSPLPTLETIRAQLVCVESSFRSCVKKHLQERRQAHEKGLAAACVSYLHTGSTQKLREHYLPLRMDGRAAAGLTDAEVRDYAAVTLQDHVVTWVGVGVYVGALLTRHGLTLKEVMDCAKDPVFVMQVLGLQVTPKTVHGHAMDVFNAVANAELERGRKVFD